MVCNAVGLCSGQVFFILFLFFILFSFYLFFYFVIFAKIVFNAFFRASWLLTTAPPSPSSSTPTSMTTTTTSRRKSSTHRVSPSTPSFSAGSNQYLTSFSSDRWLLHPHYRRRHVPARLPHLRVCHPRDLLGHRRLRQHRGRGQGGRWRRVRWHARDSAGEMIFWVCSTQKFQI